jgi:hypothetical protein
MFWACAAAAAIAIAAPATSRVVSFIVWSCLE